MTIGYHEIRRGMVFEEVTTKKARRVTIHEPGIYQACVTWTSARGLVRWMGVWNKHLIDPTRWRLVSPTPERAP